MNERVSTTYPATVVVRRKSPPAAESDASAPVPARYVLRAQHDPHRLTVKDVQVLQRTIGNAAVSQMMDGERYPVQTKRPFSHGGNRYEQEADRVARQMTHGLGTTEDRPAAITLLPASAPLEAAQSSPASDTTAPPGVADAIERQRGDGHPLARSIRAPMERAYAADFGGVKIHTDARADQLNRSLESQAFTSGHDIFFRQAAYNPETRSGRELLAHELTHVVQQKTAAVTSSVVQRKRKIDKPAFNGPSSSSYEESEANYGKSKVSGDNLKPKIQEWKVNKAKFLKKGTRKAVRDSGYRHGYATKSADEVKVASDRGWKRPPAPPEVLSETHPGDYTNYYNRSGEFTAAWNMKDYDEGKGSGAPLPNSEIIWYQYKLALDKLNMPHKTHKKGNLKQIHRATIINVQTKDTIYWCDKAVEAEDAPQTVTSTDDDFWALLGSPNGNSSAWLLLQHGVSMGASDIDSITYELGGSAELTIKFTLE